MVHNSTSMLTAKVLLLAITIETNHPLFAAPIDVFSFVAAIRGCTKNNYSETRQ